MKHYICVEEHEITYICGTYKVSGGMSGRGTVVVSEVSGIPAGCNLDGIFAELSRSYGLAGKKIILVMGRDICSQHVRVPRAGKRAVRRMARNELIAGNTAGISCLTAVDIQKGPRDTSVNAVVYYMERARLNPYLHAMEQAGMVHAGTLMIPDCTAVASHVMCKSRSSLVIDVEKEGLGLYAVEEGHCLAWKSSPLRAGRFCERNAEELLYEEIAEQARRILKDLDCGESRFRPERAILVGNCFPDTDRAASFLEKRLDMPCAGAVFERSCKAAGASPGALAAVVAGSLPGSRTLKLTSGPDREKVRRSGGFGAVCSRRFLVFFLANLLLATGAGSYIRVLEDRAAGELAQLETSMSDPTFKEQYDRINRLDSEMIRANARMEARRELSGEAAGALDRNAFEALTGAMEAGMKTEAVIYEHATHTLELILSQEYSGQVPGYVERVRDSGVFVSVNHSLWEKREDNGTERVYASVRAVLKEGEQNEPE